MPQKIWRTTAGNGRSGATVQLRELERDGILCRQIYAESPPRVEYKLSELGKTLLPVIERLDEWWCDYKRERG